MKNNELTTEEFTSLMQVVVESRKGSENEINGWVVDMQNERVVYAALLNTKPEAEYNYFCPETNNYYTELDVFESEQIALEYYLGLVIKDKKECTLWYHQLEQKLISSLEKFVAV